MTTTTESNKNRRRAEKLVGRMVSFGMDRRTAKRLGRICSLGTRRSTVTAIKIFLDWCDDNDIPSGRRSSAHVITAYLEELAADLRQKTVNQYRTALSNAYRCKLPRIVSENQVRSGYRSYRKSELLMILSKLPEKYKLPTAIAFYSGIRAHEAFTIERIDEKRSSEHRHWDAERFAFFPFPTIRYIVTGKGGLRREIAICETIAKELEKFRHKEPPTRRDREIVYRPKYDIGGGQALSQAFSAASQAALGWSLGFHGLRHSYATWRFQTLLRTGLSNKRSAELVSQELGHFRLDILGAYVGTIAFR